MAFSRVFRAHTWFSVGVRRRPTGLLAVFITAVGVVLSIYVIGAATYFVIQPWTLGALFFSGMMTIGFLTVGAFDHSDTSAPALVDWALSLLSLVSGVYFAFNAGIIEQRIWPLDPLTDWDMFFGSVVFVLTIELTRRSTGLGLTVVALLFVAYNFFGHLLGGVLQHGYIPFEHILDKLVYTTDGVFGLPIRVAATYAFLFVLFGTTLQATGGGDFFFNISSAISGRQPGGPAKIAVISSGLYGMISGSPTSDVVTTGSITIPIMRRLGYPRTLAGAVEVAASTGGSLLPPVMGSAAFIMADYTGIDYSDIAIAAIIPALLYYLCIYAQVHFRSLKLGLRSIREEDIPRVLPTLKEGGLFIVPLVVLTVALLNGYTPTMVAVFGTLTVLVVAMLRGKIRLLVVMIVVGLFWYTTTMWAVFGTLVSLLVAMAFRQTRFGPKTMVHVLSETAFRMVPVAGAVAAAGLIIGGITMTGLAGKFAHVIYQLTEARLFLTLLLAAALTIILGLGMPTPSAYILAAALMGSLLVDRLGLPMLAAHMFLLYYAVMSAITPPVAVAAYAASSIAEANPLAIAGMAVKFSLAAFIVPFGFIYTPGLLVMGSWIEVLSAVVTAVAGVLMLALAVEGFWKGALPWPPRVVLAVAGLVMFSGWYPAIGAAIVAVIVVAVFSPGFRQPRSGGAAAAPDGE